MTVSTALALLLGGACHKPPDLRALCKRICSCGCDVEECIVREKAKRDTYRTSDRCSRAIDEMTECEIEHGACDKTRSGAISYQAPNCGELLSPVLSCEPKH
ncbi:MAG: hypothetical protein ABI193_02395 [Minicystis sp.]